jgi:hypothetical protein
MTTPTPYVTRTRSMAYEIRKAERRIFNRQCRIEQRKATLIRHLQRRITSPMTLVMATGVGFIVGDLTAPHPSPRPADSAPSKRAASGESSLAKVLNWISWWNTLTTAWPLTALSHAFQAQSGAPHPTAAGEPPQPTPLPPTP